ncbi:RagB/SusD family nutrient uptake outer membrane protein [Zobellia alginiliquefaciens]|uniref:RagB/SusD family nutrient uptake outer membrane protein n=1 Tax=Zobellia alginiliquefaciens TaxID=3032586 RepID=UPI0023E39ABE|nr:RagB/SusD family nutrient uptake outer membrane protein [Zobellia alginiliquefaciens]
MNYKFSLIVLFIFLMGCSDDEESVPIIKTGDLGVYVFSGENPYPNAIVTTFPETDSLITDALGTAVFRDLELGEYEVTVVLPDLGNETFSTTTTIIEGENTLLGLEIDPALFLVPSELEIQKLIAEVYNEFRNIYGFDNHVMVWGDIGTDIVHVNRAAINQLSTLDTYSFTVGESIIEKVFADYYVAILHTNTGLDCLQDEDCLGDQEIDVEAAEAEFRFLRALAYFNLVKIYGNPVLVTTSEVDLSVSTTPVQGAEVVYDQILEDLIFAEQYLPQATKYKASKEAAQALLGKVYMQMAGFPLLQTDKYALALTQFKKITSNFELEADYADVFSVENQAADNEVIFSFDFNADQIESRSKYGSVWGPLGFTDSDGLLLNSDFITSYGFTENSENPVSFPLNIADTRFAQNIATFNVVNNQTFDASDVSDWRPLKFLSRSNIEAGSDKSLSDFPVLRYADILLLLAEAENEVNGPTQLAYDAINAVRQRAFKNDENDIPFGLNKQQFFETIFNERKLELCYEGHRKDDLVRWQLLEDAINEFNLENPEKNKDYQSHEYIWPIPLSEINLNPGVEQNPGY